MQAHRDESHPDNVWIITEPGEEGDREVFRFHAPASVTKPGQALAMWEEVRRQIGDE